MKNDAKWWDFARRTWHVNNVSRAVFKMASNFKGDVSRYSSQILWGIVTFLEKMTPKKSFLSLQVHLRSSEVEGKMEVDLLECKYNQLAMKIKKTWIYVLKMRQIAPFCTKISKISRGDMPPDPPPHLAQASSARQISHSLLQIGLERSDMVEPQGYRKLVWDSKVFGITEFEIAHSTVNDYTVKQGQIQGKSYSEHSG